MRMFYPACFVVLLCLTMSLAPAQKDYQPRIALPKQRVALKPLPPPKPDSHGHPPDIRAGTSPCGYTRIGVVSSNCGTRPAPGTSPTPAASQPPVAVYGTVASRAPVAQPAPKDQPPSRQPGGVQPRIPSKPPFVYAGDRGATWPIGVGVGPFDGLPLWSLPQDTAQHVSKELSRNGPQFPESLRMSDFRVTGFAKGDWPVVVDYGAEQGTYLLLTVVTQNAPPATAVLAVPQTGRRLQLLRLPAEFGTTLKSAAFSLTSSVSATDTTPRYLRVYGFGCGPKAVGSVAIDELRFGPQAVSTSQPETHFGFHTHTTFDKMKAEFMQIALVDNSVEGTIFDNKKIDRRIAEGESINDQWSAKKANPGQIQFRVRGWMTVRSDSDGGDWVSAFSPDLVFKQ